ncbi:hypothetical protein R5D67_14880 [Bacillus velezensis]|uniref:hypothetical protein n=1 Tax=Bacillus velezensis TaxID=492670 RepID=UPI0029E7F633|nr:hypothetical protein [Bacillus velezensis]MDX7984819.1 hypothetical protein [Bacillus velezensis]
MKEFKINLSKGEVLYTGSYICTLSKTPASTPKQISLEAAAEKLAEELIMQQAMNREHQRQQDIAVNQFRQAQEEIQRLKYENGSFKQALEKIAALKPLTNNDTNACNFQFAITTANLVLEGDGE